MKRQSLQKKRRSPRGGLFVFRSKTRRRKKQRVAASADLGSEVPNLGVARALFVILVLHVAAITAIFIHNRVTNDDAAVPNTEEFSTASDTGMGGQSREKLPVVQKGEDFYFVATGDTYERIARLKGVDVNALRDLNDNVKLKAGRILRIPSGGIVAPPAITDSSEPESTPTVVDSARDEPSNPPIMVKRDTPAPTLTLEIEQPILVKPNVPPTVEATVPVIVIPVEAGGIYTVKKGDTPWGIAKRHKVSVNNLLKANGVTDATRLRIGMKLRIPSS
jgi:LysM repeat protein